MSVTQAKVCIIGGSGLYSLFSDPEQIDVFETPFGKPSSQIVVGTVAGIPTAFLARHGIGHKLSPTNVNYRANIYALKKIGIEKCVSISAVGSLREDIKPGDIVIPDQGVDFTKQRKSTFFDEEGMVAHISLAQPFCPNLRKAVIESLLALADEKGYSLVKEGTYICIEGPALSSKAESNIYRQLGGSIIGMTMYPEVKLAREAELGYVSVNLVTDYDCWHEREESVSVEQVLKVLSENISKVQKALPKIIKSVSDCPVSSLASEALKDALIFNPAQLSSKQREKYRVLIGKYDR